MLNLNIVEIVKQTELRETRLFQVLSGYRDTPMYIVGEIPKDEELSVGGYLSGYREHRYFMTATAADDYYKEKANGKLKRFANVGNDFKAIIYLV